jgi:hypothetical protein
VDDVVVVTPPPRAHALYADKANLALLSRRGRAARARRERGRRADAGHAHPADQARGRLPADTLWAERKQWFFKPRDGFGSRAAYRGDKLTRRVFEELRADVERYVAQRVVAPSERSGGEVGSLKFDVREFVYAGEVQMVAGAPLPGQTTNYADQGRRAGGGAGGAGGRLIAARRTVISVMLSPGYRGTC